MLWTKHKSLACAVYQSVRPCANCLSHHQLIISWSFLDKLMPLYNKPVNYGC